MFEYYRPERTDGRKPIMVNRHELTPMDGGNSLADAMLMTVFVMALLGSIVVMLIF